MKAKTYYLHTIDSRPAFYEPGQQICFAQVYGKPARLARSLAQIRSEQKKSLAWRRSLGYSHEAEGYGYKRVRLPD